MDNNIHNTLVKLRNNGKYSDLMIKCGEFEFQGHKNVICSQSPFFEAACETGKWKESEGRIELKAINNDDVMIGEGDNPHAIKLLIDYFYSGDYEAVPGTTAQVRKSRTHESDRSRETVPGTLKKCTKCGSDEVSVQRSVTLACDHCMCHDCLKRAFEISVKDPAFMPPKCCTDDHIPLEHVDDFFGTKFKMLLNRKYREKKKSSGSSPAKDGKRSAKGLAERRTTFPWLGQHTST